MGGENRAALAMDHIQNVRKDIEITCERFKNWVAKQPVKTFVSNTLEAAFEGFGTTLVNGIVLHTLFKYASKRNSIPWQFTAGPKPQCLYLCGAYKPLVESLLAGGIFAGEFAIYKGMIAADKNLRGKEDVYTFMMAGFGYGVMISSVNGIKGLGVVSNGVVFALLNAAMFKVLGNKMV
ncbi:hypothetical protein QVD17_14930 [Tagetes erecta]|uniref:Uncharacterized protein n=1 Tax=Tagetes erecta TaxID=13708 RepID=A0AAD8KNB9_TARER|nr:hypothetical protein QVD17_14930 [Tagetes erecta]